MTMYSYNHGAAGLFFRFVHTVAVSTRATEVHTQHTEGRVYRVQQVVWERDWTESGPPANVQKLGLLLPGSRLSTLFCLSLWVMGRPQSTFRRFWCWWDIDLKHKMRMSALAGFARAHPSCGPRTPIFGTVHPYVCLPLFHKISRHLRDHGAYAAGWHARRAVNSWNFWKGVATDA